MLAIGRGLMAGPDILLLDEPTLGLAPIIVTEVFEKVFGDQPSPEDHDPSCRAQHQGDFGYCGPGLCLE